MKIKLIIEALNNRLKIDRELRGIEKKGNFILVLSTTPTIGQYHKFELVLFYLDEQLVKQRVLTVQKTLPCLNGLEGEARDSIISEMLTAILDFMRNDYEQYI